MNLPVAQAVSVLEGALSATKDAKLLPTIVLSPLTVSVKSFQSWCIAHKGQTVKIVTAPKDGATYVVEADKVVFDARMRYCTLPTKSTIRLVNPSEMAGPEVLRAFKPILQWRE